MYPFRFIRTDYTMKQIKVRIHGMPKPSPKRDEVYQFIKNFKCAHDGHSPTYREICDHMNWKYESIAYECVKRLVSDGKLVLDSRHRIMLVGGKYKGPSHETVEAILVLQIPQQRPKRRKRIERDNNIRDMYRAQKGLCWWCGDELHGVYQIDHRLPVAKGGSDDWANLCLACPDCNSKKSDKMPHEFNGRLL